MNTQRKHSEMNEPICQWIVAQLKRRGFTLPQDAARLSAHILKLSDHFQTQNRTTPWRSEEYQAAYLAYFFSYNFLRLQRVLSQLPEQFWSHVLSVYEIGSGAGNAQLALSAIESMRYVPYFVEERSAEAFGLHLDLAKALEFSQPQEMPSRPVMGAGSLALLSYSYNELGGALPEWCFSASHLLIVEPSTAEWSRGLMALRQDLITRGFYVLAPCTHQQACPLLTQSKRDFCHDRFWPERPAWLLELEDFLPMKNQTLTLSYLVATKKPELLFAEGRARVIGDTLFEKGKVRQAVCRGPEREFLSVLTKTNKNFEGYEHGALMTIAEDAEKRGNEIRLKG